MNNKKLQINRNFEFETIFRSEVDKLETEKISNFHYFNQKYNENSKLYLNYIQVMKHLINLNEYIIETEKYIKLLITGLNYFSKLNILKTQEKGNIEKNIKMLKELNRIGINNKIKLIHYYKNLENNFNEKNKMNNTNKNLIVSEENLMIIASFSTFSKIIDKKIERLNKKITTQLIRENKEIENPNIVNKWKQIRNSNYRDKYSVIASTLFTFSSHLNLFIKKISLNILTNTNENKDIFNVVYLSELMKIHINSLFIITKQDQLNNENEPKRIIIQINDTEIFYFHIFTLEFFSQYIEYTLNNKNVKKEHNEKLFQAKKLLKNSIILFENLKWSTIVSTFLNKNVEISGGSTVRRHITNQMNYLLSLFMYKTFDNPYHNVVISTNLIDKNLYQSKENIENNYSVHNENNTNNQNENHISEYIEQMYHNTTYIDTKFYNNNTIMESGDENISESKKNKIEPNNNTQKENRIHSKKEVTNFISSNFGRREYSTKINIREGEEFNNVNSNYLDNLKIFIEKSKTDPILAQHDIENKWMDMMFENLTNEKNLIYMKKNYIFKTVVSEALKTMEIPSMKMKLIRKFGEIGHILYDSIKSHLNITLTIMLSHYMNSSHTHIAYLVGFNIMSYIYRHHFNKNNSENKMLFNEFIFKHLLNKSNQDKNISIQIEDILDNSIHFRNLKNEFLINIGLVFIQKFVEEPVNLFYYNFKNENNRLVQDMNIPLKLMLNEDYKQELIDHIVVYPKSLPMVCSPNIWSKNKYGGFLQNEIIKEDVIKGSIQNNKHKFEGEGREKLLTTVNYFNQIKFGINNSLLDFILNEGNYLLDNVESEDKINNKITINLANIYKEVPFYLNVYADWRGRIYTHSFYITYQGSDLSSAILEFWKGETLNETGLHYFYIYGANLFGHINKESFEDRIQWVKNNLSNILNLDKELILKAKSPFLFSAFCLEMRKLNKDRSVEIKMPIFLDATCSGIQHLSGMVRDLELGTQVNLVYNQTKNNKVEDIYQFLADPINKAINEYGHKFTEYKALSELYLSRDDLKQPIMTQNYNVSVFGMKEQFYNKFKEIVIGEDHVKTKNVIKGKNKDGQEIILNNKDLMMISIIIKKVIFKEFPILKEIYDYFINVVNLMIELNLPVFWLTPSGACITQHYLKTKKQKIKWYYGNHSKTNIIRIITQKTDNRKQQNAIIPNIIHSLDASHLHNLISECNISNVKPIIAVHDCFGTLPNLTEVLLFRLKEEFIYLYLNSNFLKMFHRRLIQNIRDNNYDITKQNQNKYVIIDENIKILIPNPPIRNTLDLKFIQNSKYMFN